MVKKLKTKGIVSLKPKNDRGSFRGGKIEQFRNHDHLVVNGQSVWPSKKFWEEEFYAPMVTEDGTEGPIGYFVQSPEGKQMFLTQFDYSDTYTEVGEHESNDVVQLAKSIADAVAKARKELKKTKDKAVVNGLEKAIGCFKDSLTAIRNLAHTETRDYTSDLSGRDYECGWELYSAVANACDV